MKVKFKQTKNQKNFPTLSQRKSPSNQSPATNNPKVVTKDSNKHDDAITATKSSLPPTYVDVDVLSNIIQSVLKEVLQVIAPSSNIDDNSLTTIVKASIEKHTAVRNKRRQSTSSTGSAASHSTVGMISSSLEDSEGYQPSRASINKKKKRSARKKSRNR